MLYWKVGIFMGDCYFYNVSFFSINNNKQEEGIEQNSNRKRQGKVGKVIKSLLLC